MDIVVHRPVMGVRNIFVKRARALALQDVKMDFINTHLDVVMLAQKTVRSVSMRRFVPNAWMGSTEISAKHHALDV